jgi:hypothetical protein
MKNEFQKSFCPNQKMKNKNEKRISKKFLSKSKNEIENQKCFSVQSIRKLSCLLIDLISEEYHVILPDSFLDYFIVVMVIFS